MAALEGANQNIIIGGMDMTFSGPSPITLSILNAVGGSVYNYNLFQDVDKEFVAKIVKDIKANYRSGNSLKIYGYSKGGDIAMQVTRALNAENIPVSLLVTIDAADGPLSDNLDRTIPGNVTMNYNFYQTTPSLIRSHGAANTGSGIIFNFDLTGSFIHSNIDDASVNTAIFLMRNR